VRNQAQPRPPRRSCTVNDAATDLVHWDDLPDGKIAEIPLLQRLAP
jgi:hypothetical protein